MHHRFNFQIIALLLCLGGCDGSWNVRHVEGPLVAPGQMAEQRYRAKDNWSGVPGQETIWVDAKGNRYDLNKVGDSFTPFLQANGVLSTWPKTGGGSSGIDTRLAPYRIFIATLDPMIVILIPHDYGSPIGRSDSEIIGRRPAKSVRNSYLINYVQYGTRIPFHENAEWLSADLNIVPTPITIDALGNSSISFPTGTLTLTRHDDIWQLTRQ